MNVPTELIFRNEAVLRADTLVSPICTPQQLVTQDDFGLQAKPEAIMSKGPGRDVTQGTSKSLATWAPATVKKSVTTTSGRFAASAFLTGGTITSRSGKNGNVFICSRAASISFKSFQLEGRPSNLTPALLSCSPNIASATSKL